MQSKSLQEVHSEISTQGQTAAPAADAPVDLHFVCFVRDSKSGELVELDGRRKGPVRRGVDVPLQKDLLKSATQWIQQNYMSLNPAEVNFNLIALAPEQS